jgi:hypothetical protein
MSAISANSELSILRRVVDPEQGNLPRPAAEAILRLDLHQNDRARMEELLEKNRACQLTPEEEEELENYSRVGRFLDLIRSKARHTLQASDS